MFRVFFSWKIGVSEDHCTAGGRTTRSIAISQMQVEAFPAVQNGVTSLSLLYFATWVHLNLTVVGLKYRNICFLTVHDTQDQQVCFYLLYKYEKSTSVQIDFYQFWCLCLSISVKIHRHLLITVHDRLLQYIRSYSISKSWNSF